MGFFSSATKEQKITEEELEEAELHKKYKEFTDAELRNVAKGMYQYNTMQTARSLHQDIKDRNTEKIKNSKETVLNKIRERLTKPLLSGYTLTKEQANRVIELVKSLAWGYGILDPLIADDSISDIKIYSANDIRIKRNGQREAANVAFDSEEDCRNFITRILERNGINLGASNANQTFTDSSQKQAILRISVISELLCDSKKPCMAIRKIEKQKLGLNELSARGMFGETPREDKDETLKQIASSFVIDNPVLSDLIPKFVMSKGLLFTGKGASGKTTFMNALLDLIPQDESIMICQENSELFVKNHPDCLCTHVDVNGGDSKISYTLGDLTRMGLLIDLDRIIVGEVKQADEAAGLSKASLTGHKCWTSVHGENCDMAIDKMADYISQANRNYSFADCLSMLQGFEYVIHLRKFQIDEVVHITGWDRKNETLIKETVYKI